MLHHLRLIPFVLGVVMGVIGILFVNPEQVLSYKYPVPEQAKEIVYKDRNGICYQYLSSEVSCDKNEARLKPFPLNR